jgi:hypothetical protein
MSKIVKVLEEVMISGAVLEFNSVFIYKKMEMLKKKTFLHNPSWLAPKS